MSMTNEVILLKRYWNMLGGATVCLAACGLTASLMKGQTGQMQEIVSRACFLAAIACFFAAALMRPRAYQLNSRTERNANLSTPANSLCTFGDVAANEEARRSLSGLVDYLKNPEKYARYGARMPKGVLLYGPPGTGKTLLAKALAGEAGVPFFALSGSDFVEMYVGVGAGRVRELFQNARKAGKCVVFIDEIDALGRRREQANSEERDQTLNALLSEMSGFRDSQGIIVLAATNRLESLDPALLRPGRFDRQIEVGLPGRGERLSILRLHGKNKPMSDNVDLDALAADTTAFSGASLENLLNEAAIAAAERNADKIDIEDIRGAFLRATAGADRECTANERERRAVSVHEAGHAVAACLLTPENRLRRVSILPTGRGAAGYNLTVPAERVMPEKGDLERQIQVLLAGRAAEMLLNGEDALTAGAASDLARAAELASAMVMDFGMGGDPAVSVRTLVKNCGGGQDAAQSCRRLLTELFARTLDCLAEHRAELNRLSQRLLECEALNGEEVVRIVRGAA